jgi:hypothetical protein
MPIPQRHDMFLEPVINVDVDSPAYCTLSASQRCLGLSTQPNTYQKGSKIRLARPSLLSPQLVSTSKTSFLSL